MSHKKRRKKSLQAPSVSKPLADKKILDSENQMRMDTQKKSSFISLSRTTVDKEITPQLFQIPPSFSLWIAAFIAILLLLLIIAGQSGPSSTGNTSVKLQLPSEQNKPLLLQQGNIQLPTLAAGKSP